MANMLHALEQGVMIVAHNKAPPSNEEFEAFSRLQAELVRAGQVQAMLVLSIGGGPGVEQRKKLAAIVEGLPVPPTAMLTSSTLVRGVVTAINWIRPSSMKTFPPTAMTEALASLGAAPELHGAIKKRAFALLKELGVPSSLFGG